MDAHSLTPWKAKSMPLDGPTHAIDEQKLQALMGLMVNELGAAQNAALVILGDELGLYQALHRRGPLTSQKLAEAFRTGEGVCWTKHCNCLFCGTDRFFRPGYRAHLLAEWLPALDGVVDKLERGARVADVGCGHGTSTRIMAEAFPNSEFVGIDFHDESVAEARKAAAHIPNLRFETARAQDFEGRDFDLITLFDALHDMGDPVGAARHIAGALAPRGKVMLVEPMAGDVLEQNLHPVGRIFYAASTNFCVPASLGQEVGAALGAQAGQARLEAVLREGGLANVRRAAETPFNMVLEASR